MFAEEVLWLDVAGGVAGVVGIGVAGVVGVGVAGGWAG